MWLGKWYYLWVRGEDWGGVWSVLLKSLSGAPCLILSTHFLFISPFILFSSSCCLFHPIPGNELFLLVLFLNSYSHVCSIFAVDVCDKTFSKKFFYLWISVVQHSRYWLTYVLKFYFFKFELNCSPPPILQVFLVRIGFN